MHDFITGTADQVFRFRPQALGHAKVNPDDMVMCIKDGDEVGNRVEGALPFLLGPAQRRLDVLAVSDVEGVEARRVGWLGKREALKKDGAVDAPPPAGSFFPRSA